MKTTIPRLILYLILLIQACAVVIPDYQNTPLLICTCILMVVLAVAVFTNRNHSMAKHMLWYAGAGLLLFFAFPEGMPFRVQFGRILSGIGEGIVYSLENPLALMCLASFVLQRVLFRNKFDAFFMILRYIAACILMVILSQEMFGNYGYQTELFVIVFVLCLVYEMNSILNGARCRRLLAAILFCAFCLVVEQIFGYGVAYRVNSFITLGDTGWLYTVLAVLVVGLLLILENLGDSLADRELGQVMLCWCILALAMQKWNMLLNATVLFVFFPFVFYIYCIFVQSYRKNPVYRNKNIFVKSWIFILLAMAAFAKSLNFLPFTAATMCILFVAGYLCWNASKKQQKDFGGLYAFFGIAAIMLMASTSFYSLYELQDNVSAVIAILLVCVMWLYVCGETRKVNARASEAYPAEYKQIFPIQRIGAVAALVLATIRVLVL